MENKEAFKKYSEYLEDFENKNTYEHGFKDGAKWQQENSYSEEEVETIAKDAYAMGRRNVLISAFNYWFEQFKKK
jgi:hypothetical protein